MNKFLLNVSLSNINVSEITEVSGFILEQVSRGANLYIEVSEAYFKEEICQIEPLILEFLQKIGQWITGGRSSCASVWSTWCHRRNTTCYVKAVSMGSKILFGTSNKCAEVHFGYQNRVLKSRNVAGLIFTGSFKGTLCISLRWRESTLQALWNPIKHLPQMALATES